MITLLVSLLIGWLLLKLMWPRGPIRESPFWRLSPFIEPPPPQVVVHLQRDPPDFS